MRETILKADGLYHVYESKAEDGNVVALRGLHINMKEGEAIAVVGPSGSGKSTLMKCLGGLMKPSAGSVTLAGKNMTRLTGQELVELRQKKVSFIFQEGNLLPNLNARDNVAQPLRHQGVASKKALALADAMLERLGMGHRINALPAMLSGGEQQRVAIARALITQPRLILADEPTGALDPVTSREVLALFKNLHQNDSVSFLIVTHSKEVASFANRSLELRDGRFVAEHGLNIDVEDLSKDRELIIDETGTVTLPPDLLVQLGGAGRYTVGNVASGYLSLQGEAIEAMGALVLASKCPACKQTNFAPRLVQVGQWLRVNHEAMGIAVRLPRRLFFSDSALLRHANQVYWRRCERGLARWCNSWISFHSLPFPHLSRCRKTMEQNGTSPRIGCSYGACWPILVRRHALGRRIRSSKRCLISPHRITCIYERKGNRRP
jgi:putative ABC transport system ATP-binding protein